MMQDAPLTHLKNKTKTITNAPVSPFVDFRFKDAQLDPRMTQSPLQCTLSYPWTRGIPIYECCSLTTAQP
jgi:hypothetical protein